jgi:hypothetical protein
MHNTDDYHSGSSLPTAIDTPPDSSAWAVSLCFWMALTLAALSYGVVALAAKFAVWNEVRHEYRRNAIQLVALEKDVSYLERVQVALETDPEFVQRLTEAAGNETPDAKGELIPVSGDLLFGQEDQIDPTLQTATDPPPWDATIRQFASNTRLRSGMLLFSAGLTIFAFAFLNDAGSGLVRSTGRILKATMTISVSRYVTKTADSTMKSPDAHES